MPANILGKNNLLVFLADQNLERLQGMASYDTVLDIFKKLHGCGAGDDGLELLSSKGKILAAMLQHDRLSVKDIPHLAGVSFRTCFEQLRLLEMLGVVEKTNDPLDGRRSIVKLNIEKLSKTIETGAKK
jgi:hypothetical protein